MGRPRLGDAAKTQAVSVRITRAEQRLLEKMYGSASRGLRAILDQWKTKDQ